MVERIASSGKAPASLSRVALTMIMNRIVGVSWKGRDRDRAPGRSRTGHFFLTFFFICSRVASSRAASAGGKFSGGKSDASNKGRISHSPRPKTLRKRVVHSIASAIVLTSNNAYEATSSFDSVKGPSVTVTFPPSSRTRLPFELGCSPSVASNTPAFVISSMNVPIRSMRSLLGGAPASESASALSSPMNRIVEPPFGVARSVTTPASNDGGQDRQDLGQFREKVAQRSGNQGIVRCVSKRAELGTGY